MSILLMYSFDKTLVVDEEIFCGGATTSSCRSTGSASKGKEIEEAAREELVVLVELSVLVSDSGVLPKDSAVGGSALGVELGSSDGLELDGSDESDGLELGTALGDTDTDGKPDDSEGAELGTGLGTLDSEGPELGLALGTLDSEGAELGTPLGAKLSVGLSEGAEEG